MIDIVGIYAEGTRAQIEAMLRFPRVIAISRAARRFGRDRWRIGAKVADVDIPAIEALGLTVTVSMTKADLKKVGPTADPRDYPTSLQIQNRLDTLAVKGSPFCTVTELTKSQHGASIPCLKIEKGPTSKKCLITAGIHAREWAPPTAVLTCFERLIAAYTASPIGSVTCGGRVFKPDAIKSIVENLNIYVVPMLNPEGYEYARGTDKFWRKNRADPPPVIPPECVSQDNIGVDINRNFDIAWEITNYYSPDALKGDGERTVSASSNPCEFQVYKGPGKLSEPESKAIDAFLRTGIKYFLDCHSFAHAVLYPWGIEQNQGDELTQNYGNTGNDHQRGDKSIKYGEFIDKTAEANLKHFAKVMKTAMFWATGDAYAVQAAWETYFAPGTAADYAFKIGVPIPLILECGSEHEKEFWPRYLKEFPKIESEVHAGILAFLGEAAKP